MAVAGMERFYPVAWPGNQRDCGRPWSLRF